MSATFGPANSTTTIYPAAMQAVIVANLTMTAARTWTLGVLGAFYGLRCRVIHAAAGGFSLTLKNTAGQTLATLSNGDEASFGFAPDSSGGDFELIPGAFASASDYRTRTANRILTADAVWGAADIVSLTDAATIAVDMSLGINFLIPTLGGNRTLGNPTNPKRGQSGLITVNHDGTRTLAYSSFWRFVGGVAPVLTSGAAAKDVLHYFAESDTSFLGWMSPDMR